MTVCRFSIIVSREERPAYEFKNIISDKTSYGKGSPFYIQTTRRVMSCGDYAIEGWDHRCVVERKTVPDFLQSAVGRHEWFDGCLKRMATTREIAAVIVEGTLATCYKQCRKNLNKPLFRSVLSWTHRYPNVHWFFMENRRDAELATFRFLEMWYRHHIREN